MSKQFKAGYDIDTKELSNTLREIAEGIDNGSVAIKAISESHTADPEDVSVAKLELEYLSEDSDLISPIKYAEDN